MQPSKINLAIGLFFRMVAAVPIAFILAFYSFPAIFIEYLMISVLIFFTLWVCVSVYIKRRFLEGCRSVKFSAVSAAIAIFLNPVVLFSIWISLFEGNDLFGPTDDIYDLLDVAAYILLFWALLAIALNIFARTSAESHSQ
ncbi:MAG: hypothetical protein AAGF76_03615 [Pseudomonadota bacterium]